MYCLLIKRDNAENTYCTRYTIDYICSLIAEATNDGYRGKVNVAVNQELKLLPTQTNKYTPDNTNNSVTAQSLGCNVSR